MSQPKPSLVAYSPGHATGYIVTSADYDNDVLAMGTWAQQMLGAVTSFPATPNAGDTCFRSDLGAWFRYDATTWQQMGAASFTTALRPASPPTGFTYLDLTDGHIYCYSGSAYALRGSRVKILDYAAGTDVMNGVAMSAGAYTDVHTAQSFTVTDAQAAIEITVDIGAIVSTASASIEWAATFLIDGTTHYGVGGNVTGGAGTFRGATGGIVDIGTLSAASHTVKAQLVSINAATGYCRAASFPVGEFLRIQVHENHP